jgi:hypothetical protein
MRLRGGRAALLAGLLLCAAAPVTAQAVRDSAARAAHDPAGRALARDSLARTLARDPSLRAAERAAREWLYLLDEARYDSAWSVVAPAMRSVVGYREWTTSLTQLRSALPFRIRRELLRAEPSVPLFGGSSVILSFAVGRGSMREIVVLVRTSERWLIGGYGILLY